MTSEFLRAECCSPKQAEFIININFLIEIKKVSVQYFYLTSLAPFPNRICYLLHNYYNYALSCATAPVFFYLSDCYSDICRRFLSSDHLRFVERTRFS